MASEKLFKGGVEIQNGAFILRVTKDRLQAVVTPKDTKGGGVQLDQDLLKKELAENGIVGGVLPAPEAAGGGSFSVAKGIPPVPGENAKVKMHVKPAIPGPQKADPDKDQVDYRELGTIVNVAKDRLLLEKVAPSQGKAGQDVFGIGIPAKPGKDSKLKYGKGVTLSPDESKISAALDGKFVMSEGKPTVLGEHSITGDVDMKVGNIVFGGSNLTISGEVLPGFSVKCRGDIKIGQGVNNSFVMAGGFLTVLGGVVGEEAKLRAKGDITVDFVENGPKLETAGYLRVNDVLLQAQASVGKDVIATQGNGTIIGGKIIAAGSVHVKEMGCDAEVATEVCVGLVPSLQMKKQKIVEELGLWSDRLNEVIKNISALEKIKKELAGKFPEDKSTLLAKCRAFMPKAMDKVNFLTEEDKALELELEQMVNEQVYVYGHLFPGVVVKIGSLVRTITLEEEQSIIYFDKTSHQILVRKMTREERDAMPS
ncbi:MAG: FapA family protein [Proteobacteria bacterium]|nr:FapA family protein [Pseudomonadota bacterium]MBU4034608.1 FapA family protein [Pseudomonadota bacterium]